MNGQNTNIQFKLNEKEKIRFFSKFRSDDNVMKNLLYYQYDCKSVFENSDNVDQVRLVMKYGQNNSKRRERK